jgi:hypothetical protein
MSASILLGSARPCGNTARAAAILAQALNNSVLIDLSSKDIAAFDYNAYAETTIFFPSFNSCRKVTPLYSLHPSIGSQ